ncbi:MAG: hypothetical protein HY901_37640, partial [Deltaproteobacteria bacterium]|nr:hypothetical protein [Deltaproteobacteria bacterium]
MTPRTRLATAGIASLLVLLALPSAAHADFGASLSAGAGVQDVNHDQNHKWRTAFELAPFFQKWILRFEVPVEMTVSPSRLFAVRPGVKAFLPILGLYARAGYGLGNLGGDGEAHHSLIAGIGKQFILLDTVGILL